MPSRYALFMALFASFFLAACGEWELTTTHFPYGNQRTAGSGVIYVREHMMPKKELKIAPADDSKFGEASAPAEYGPEQDTSREMEKVFNKKQAK